MRRGGRAATGWPKQRRGLRSNVSHVIRVIQYIERVERNRKNLGFLLRLRKREIVGQVQVQTDLAGPRHRVARDPSGTIIEDAVVIIVATSSDIDWLARVKGERDTQRKESRGLSRRQQIELLESVIIGASPIRRRRYSCSRENT